MSALIEVPYPLRWPLFGNVRQFMNKKNITTLNQIAEKYDGIYELVFPGEQFYVVYKHDYVQELLEGHRFQKTVDSSLREIRELSGDGLFTAFTEEPNWKLAHRLLTPAFSMKNMRHYLPVMVGVARELVGKWHQHGDGLVAVSDDMTRYTLETIGRCGFDYSFHSFAHEKLDPFIGAMNRSLAFALNRGHLLPFQRKLAFSSNARFDRDRDFMNKIVDGLIQKRRNDPEQSERQDLLNMMLQGKDKDTGMKLDDSNIRYQLITFLIAGHETTSGLLSFTIYLLLKHPEVLQKVRQELDEVIGTDIEIDITLNDIARLHYLGRVLKEALRMYPTAPGFFVASPKEESVGDKYRLRAGRSSFILLDRLHRDPDVWGPDACSFDPDRFLPERISKIPSTAYRPFGNGHRACIGQNFAIVEATVAIAYIVQQFDLIDTAHYQLEVIESMTIKPKNFYLRARPRFNRYHHVMAG